MKMKKLVSGLLAWGRVAAHLIVSLCWEYASQKCMFYIKYTKMNC